MQRNDYDLHTILDIPNWEPVQDRLAEVTGTAIITVDYKGIPITKHSGRTDFCSVIRENRISQKRCHRCDALASLEAVRLGRPYIYLCHCGIVDVAVPILVGDRHLGAVMFGQVRIPNNDGNSQIERLVSEISSFQTVDGTARADLLEMYERLPEMEYQRIVEIADLINAIVKYIVGRAIKSHTNALTYEWLMSVNGRTHLVDEEMQELRKKGFAQLEELLLPDHTNVSENSPIYPAVVYINEHPRERILMRDMADLCHLSHSYFSRLFVRELGENFLSYVNRQKIQLAKQMLRETNLSVQQITGEIGFLNTSHFIDVFKKLEGLTPVMYRQQQRVSERGYSHETL